MTPKRNPARMLVILGIGITLGAAASAQEAMSPPPEAMAQPGLAAPAAEPAAVPAAAPEATLAIPAPPAPEATAATGEAQVPPSTAETYAPFFAPALPPPSLQTLVDQRRDQLRAERNAWLDANRQGAMPPWLADYNTDVERYRDAMQSLWRQRRDYDQARHNRWMDAICPWSKPQRDWSRQRSFETQMRQLDRREAMEAYRFSPAYGFGAPPRW